MRNYCEITAPAKINLVLKVLKRRPDGYHEIYSVFQKVTLEDRIILKKASTLSLEIEGPVSVPLHHNLCLTAARLYFQKAGLKEGARLHLWKNIPVGAGLGGGSSDAASVLKGLNVLYEALSPEELIQLGPEIGADVTFFLSPFSTALAQGIGEKLSPWPTFPAWYVILCPDLKISTAWAYRNLRLTTPSEPPNYVPDQPLWKQGLVNDFERLVFAEYPALARLKEELRQRGACAALLTGSGAALFGVFEEREGAEKAALYFREKGLRAEVVTNYQ